MALIRAYQMWVSPYLPSSCIFSPSCSEYALESYQRYGFWRATRATAWRLLRCGRWSVGGCDPVQ